MVEVIKNYIRNFFFTKKVFNGRLSFSQEGEDILLARYLESKKPGFYVDIGAHHPERFSNTKYFYDRGWSGLNIEPNPILFKEFIDRRKRDINLNIGISQRVSELDYYMFNEPALNTFSVDEAKKKEQIPHYNIIETQKVKVLPFFEVQKEYLKDKKIDFLNIDAEGLDFEILKSIDFSLNDIDFILVEDFESQEYLKANTQIDIFLLSKNYKLVSKLLNTKIYKCH